MISRSNGSASFLSLFIISTVNIEPMGHITLVHVTSLHLPKKSKNMKLEILFAEVLCLR